MKYEYVADGVSVEQWITDMESAAAGSGYSCDVWWPRHVLRELAAGYRRGLSLEERLAAAKSVMEAGEELFQAVKRVDQAGLLPPDALLAEALQVYGDRRDNTSV